MINRILLSFDWRPEARAVRNLLRKRDIRSLCDVHSRLRTCPHNYPHGLLKLLLIEMPEMKPSTDSEDFVRIAADLFRTAEWEMHERNRQLIM